MHLSNDFNGDGRSDVLLRDFAGAIHFLYGSPSGGLATGPSLGWTAVTTIVGTGDFNGDGRQDILLNGGYSNPQGSLLISALQTVTAGFQSDWDAATMLPATWSVIGTGDFNGDGKTDVLLRNDDGSISDWLVGPADSTIVDVADAPFIPNPLFFQNPGNQWHVVGTGDFNGDGRSDILWRHDSGLIVDWLGQPNGSLRDNGSSFLVNPGNQWQVAGTGDFNGDGRTDILWRHDSGVVVDWLGQSNGSFVDNASNFLVNPGTHWNVADVGDFNGDGFADILWRHDTGLIVDWLGQANGSFVDNAANSLINLSSDWQVQPNLSGAGAWDY
jgi:hypothetical protein